MIEFFRDTLSGPLYYIVLILGIVSIMAIIGFILERKQNQEEKDSKIAYVDASIPTPTQEEIKPINSIEINTEQTQVETNPVFDVPAAPTIEEAPVINEPAPAMQEEPVQNKFINPINLDDANNDNNAM